MSDMLSAALAYADLGYPVFPCAPGKKIPACKHGVLDATIDAPAIESWWTDMSRANIGLATAGLLVVDVDIGAGDWPHDPDHATDLSRAPCAVTPRGGRHYVFAGPGANSVSRLAPHVDTRGDGGYIVVAPSPGYRWIVELDRRENLPAAPAWITGAMIEKPPISSAENEIPEGSRNDTLMRLAGVMRRVGMSEAEIVAALDIANAARCRPPLAGPEVAAIAHSVARYEPDQVAVAVVENHWAQDVVERPNGHATPDPGPIPERLLSVPGFVGAVVDYCLATAPYPNRVLALTGAIALQAILCARKIQDESGTRTNPYLLALANSGAGKDWPRKINQRVLHAVGAIDSLGGRFASGEGIQDALSRNPAILYQTDEIDDLIRSVTLSRENRHGAIMSTLLEIYGAASGVYAMRHRAGDERSTVIDQPHLVLMGTAVPSCYYDSLSERMLSSGFFARVLVFDAGQRGAGKRACAADPPKSIIATAKTWAEFRPGKGNLDPLHPRPHVVPTDADAAIILDEYRARCDGLYSAAESAADIGAISTWTRAPEHASKLALIRAASEDPKNLRVRRDAAQWAVDLVDHLVRRMLWAAGRHVAADEDDAKRLRLLRAIQASGGEGISHRDALKNSHLSARAFRDVIETLLERGDIGIRREKTKTKPKITYFAS